MKRIDPTHERVDGIGHAEVGPAVATGAGDENFETSRGERFRGDVIGAGAVENDCGFEFGAVGVDESAHAAEVAFAFFADIGDEENCAARFDSGFMDRARDGDQCGQAGAVVGNSRRVQAFGVAANFHFGAGRKDGVEMRGEHDDFFVGDARKLGDDVAGFVDRDAEAAIGEERPHGVSARRFLKWRRGNFGDADLLLVNPVVIARKPGKRRADFGGFGDLRSVSGAVRRTDGANWHDRKDNAKKQMFHG